MAVYWIVGSRLALLTKQFKLAKLVKLLKLVEYLVLGSFHNQYKSPHQPSILLFFFVISETLGKYKI